MDLGNLRELTTGHELRYERRMNHPPAKVWRALTENDQLKAWFPAVVEGEWVVDAPLRFAFTGEHLEGLPDDALRDWDDADFRGEVVEVDEPRRLAYTWNRDLLTFDLIPDGDGCLLIFTTVLLGREHLCRTAAGWHECLDILAAMGNDEPWTLPHAERWAQVHPRYERAFGPDPGEPVG